MTFILNSKDSEGRTALHLYVAVDNRKLVRYLTSREDCQLSVQDHMQRTPLHLAAILGGFCILQQFSANLKQLMISSSQRAHCKQNQQNSNFEPFHLFLVIVDIKLLILLQDGRARLQLTSD